jgi:hypothetical protein
MPQTVRILRGFAQYTKGQLVTIGGGVADVWKIETAALEPQVEKADRTPRRRRKP